MTFFALMLLLASAFLHAGWNLVAKRVAGGAAFTWLFSVMAVFLVAPVVVAGDLLQQIPWDGPLVAAVLGSGFVEVLYYLLLQKGYRFGDLSVVYPVARGTGPVLATSLALVLLGENPSPLNLFGTACVVTGIFIIAGGMQLFRRIRTDRGLSLGLATGACIAGYSTIDKFAVGVARVHPVVYFWLVLVVQVLFLTPWAFRERGGVGARLKVNGKSALAIALLSTASYVAVLYALRISPLSIIAPAREAGIVIGVFLGTTVLGEGGRSRRLIGSTVVLAGLGFLSLG
jgi:drug/metabolite transporter (DMT)-like permease